MRFCRALLRLPPLFFLLFFLFACVKEKTAEEHVPAPEAETAVPEPEAGAFPFFSPETMIAVLRPGQNPLWFDISGGSPEDEGGRTLAGGIRIVDSPAEAALAPFTPWPLARHAAAALVWEDALYLALNRDSMLVFLPLEGGDLGLYRLTGGPYWESFTLGTLFLYNDRPSLFFYRDHNFADPADSPPDPPVLTLIPGAGDPGAAPFARLEPLELPAPAEISPAEGWEADILRPGADGFWYYRLTRPRNDGWESRYFRAPDLSLGGEEVHPGLYRNSQREDPAPEISALPPLPEDFVYTRVVRLGDLSIAAWEEQQDYSIGAAGFMVLRGKAEAPGSP
ncbi:MAG: hypothetical protein LBH51_01385 [Treponema sp.]|jgi:hypothetical protein|nr:hypothetical protein [Treponema sp.]